jgi:hypothetical protein
MKVYQINYFTPELTCYVAWEVVLFVGARRRLETSWQRAVLPVPLLVKLSRFLWTILWGFVLGAAVCDLVFEYPIETEPFNS